MRKIALTLAILGTTLLTAFYTAPAQAQATRTWISGVGDDANPCSRTAPCKTFPGAISKTAAGGEIDCLDPGGFGAVTITKAITLDCASGEGGQVGSILVAGTNAIVINATPTGASVTIRNISINGDGSGLNGIRYISGSGALHVENAEIFGFVQKGIDFENTAAANLFVRNSVISDNNDPTNGGAIFVKPQGAVAANVSVYHSALDRNLFGVRVEDGGKATVEDTVAHANNGNGFLAVSASSAAEINLIHSVASNTASNGVGTSGANARINMYYSAVTDNGTGINTSSGGVIATTSPATNLNFGNTAPGAFNGTVNLQ
jgi:hypothetical protein